MSPELSIWFVVLEWSWWCLEVVTFGCDGCAVAEGPVLVLAGSGVLCELKRVVPGSTVDRWTDVCPLMV